MNLFGRSLTLIMIPRIILTMLTTTMTVTKIISVDSLFQKQYLMMSTNFYLFLDYRYCCSTDHKSVVVLMIKMNTLK
ncbi:GSCOCG00003255001-RA-CDS [Cotesia congregata]|nr:GSCOCG00003255001-RA-CDS [Cotesia congregata]